MSFCSNIKNKICANNNISDCCKKAEICGMIFMSQASVNEKIKIISENKNIVTRFSDFVRDTFSIPVLISERNNKINSKTSVYLASIENPYDIENVLLGLDLIRGDGSISLKRKGEHFEFECCFEAFMRGVFLANGSITDPNREYHLEFVCNDKAKANKLIQMLNKFDIHAKITERKKNFIVYIKESEKISDFFGLIGSVSSVLDIINIKIEKEMKNNINRIANCETYNVDKTSIASSLHIMAINYIKSRKGSSYLPEILQEIADIRLLNPELNLKELGEKAVPPISKSAVNYRLGKIIDIYAELINNNK